jgi:2-hydroxychromene-2-carboxylate isomerase
MSGASDIRFYFDFISHNAYIAWTQIHPLAQRYGRRVEPVPVLFAAFLDAYGQRGPAEIPAKSAWMIRDILRKSARLGLGLAPPASHPFNPLVALRVVSQPMADEPRTRVIDRLFRAAWCESLALDDGRVVAKLLSELGLDGAACVDACAAPAAKQALRARTDEALRDGVFGVPSMRVGDELFWGYDDFAHLELYLQGADPLPRGELAAWASVRPSATRRPLAARDGGGDKP